MIKSFLGRLVMILILVVLLVIVLNQLGLFKPQIRSYPAEIKLLKNEFETDGIIFRNEVLLASSQAGEVSFTIEDGERVPQGTVIATVTPETTEQSYTPFELDSDWLIDMEKIDQEYASAQEQLAYLVKSGRTTEVEEVKAQIDQILGIRNAYSKHQGLVAQNSVISSKRGSGDRIQIEAPNGGIVAYTVAEDDSLFNPANIPLLDFDQYKFKSQGQIIRKVLPNQPFMRLVKNRESYIVIRCDEATMKWFTPGRRIDVVINEQNIRPVVANIYRNDQDYIIQLTVLEEYENDYNERVNQIQVIAQQLEGLAIKTKSLVEQEKVLGVYVLKKGYRSQFVPVKVLGTFGEEAIIASDHFLQTEGNESKVIPTVNLYDEILEDPKQ